MNLLVDTKTQTVNIEAFAQALNLFGPLDPTNQSFFDKVWSLFDPSLAFEGCQSFEQEVLVLETKVLNCYQLVFWRFIY